MGSATAGFGVVRCISTDTGEVKERPMAGVDGAWPWEQTSLELALALVPDLVEAIDRARRRGRSVDVRLLDAESAITHAPALRSWRAEVSE